MVGLSSDDLFRGDCHVEEGVEAKLVGCWKWIDGDDADLRATCASAPYLLANADRS